MWRALGAAVLATVALGGCGGDGGDPEADTDALGAGVVANVAGEPVERSELERWMRLSAATERQLLKDSTALGLVPEPPGYERCVQVLRKILRKSEEAAEVPADDELRARCEEARERLEHETLDYLIEARWIVNEAERRDLDVDPDEVRELYESQVDAMPGAGLARVLDVAGLTRADLREAARISLLRQELLESVPLEPVGDADVRRFYQQNREKLFTRPESRRIRVIVTKERQRAREAVSALRAGASWDEVASEYSIDESKRDGGRILLPAGARPELDAVFRARPGRLTGPIKVPYGWYAFEVESTVPAGPVPVEDVASSIREKLHKDAEGERAQRFEASLVDEWGARTTCAAGFTSDRCRSSSESAGGS